MTETAHFGINGLIKVLSKCCYLLLIATISICIHSAQAQQKDSTDKLIIHPTADVFIFNKTDSGDVGRFIGNARFTQGTDTLYCDSLHYNKTTRIIEAFSNVRIAQEGGTEGRSHYLRYTIAKKLAFMDGDVSLTDGKNRLECEQLTYDLGIKKGIFNDRGTLHADSTIVVSNRGEYDVKNKEARFSGKVIVTDPHYKTVSDDMGFNTETKVTRFFGPSVVTGDSGKTILHSSSGYYDGSRGIASFFTHSTIWYDGQFIEGDTLYFNRETGYGYAYNNVYALDTAHHSGLYAGRAVYNRRKRTLKATEKPVLEQVNGKDTLFVRADTFYSAPVLKNDTAKGKITQISDRNDNNRAGAAKETTNAAKKEKNKRKKGKEQLPVSMAAIDTSWADTTAPLYFSGYHNVRIYSDSLQGVCDSIVFTQADSTVRMIYKPIAWSRKSQITGDTICLQLDSNSLKSVYVPNNAFVVSLAGPEKAELYDQVQGKTLRGFLKNNALTDMVVAPDAEAIYYSKDDAGAYIGVSQASSTKMRIIFEDQQIHKIRLEQDVHQTLTPMTKADLPNSRLSRFKWLMEKRPKSKAELFE